MQLGFMKRLLGLLTLSVVCSCVTPPQTSISIDLKKSTSEIEFSKFIEDVTLVGLKTGEDFIGSIDRIRVAEDYIVVLDGRKNTVFVFNRSGELLSTINRQGRGPQEYVSIGDLDVYNETIIVFDDETSNVLRYDIKGRFIDKISVCEGVQMKVDRKGNYIVFSGYGFEGHEVTCYDSTGTMLYEAIRVDKSRSSLPIPFNNAMSLTEYRDELLVTTYFDYNVYSIKNGDAKIKYSFDFGDENFPPSLLDVKSPVGFHKKILTDKSVHSVDSFVETSGWLIFSAGTKNVYYNKKKSSYFVSGKDLKMPYAFYFSGQMMGYDAETGCCFTRISASNIKNALVPYLSRNETGFRSVDALREMEINENTNDFIIFIKFKQ